ncbi:DUF4190 domain-containing protein [Streptomyces sp. NPDC048603]|uniref:DUF4190 domain-containing protein n=1 Tax=Streptomyces sp. NPDC048603 TaxID=3365577 RepID=UPI003724A967
MTDQSPESRDPWALPEAPAAGGAAPQGGQGAGPAAPSVHDQPTIIGMPGAGGVPPGEGQRPAAGQGPGAGAPQPPGAPYGYPHAGSGGYGYPGHTGAQPVPPAQPVYPVYPGYPGQTAYPPYGTQMRNGFGVTALVLGIIAAVFFCLSFLSVFVGIVAIVFGVLGRARVARGEADNGGLALAGIILGAVGVVIGGVMATFLVIGIVNDRQDDDDYDYTPPSTSTSRVLYRT